MSARVSLGVVLLALIGWNVASAGLVCTDMTKLPGTPTNMKQATFMGNVTFNITIKASKDNPPQPMVLDFPVIPGDLVLIETGTTQMAAEDPSKRGQWSDFIKFTTQNDKSMVFLYSDAAPPNEDTGFNGLITDSNICFLEETRLKGPNEDPDKDDETTVTKFKVEYDVKGKKEKVPLYYSIQSDGAPKLNPEPSTITLLGLGALGLFACRCRRRRQAAP
jgi:hypothetical protein